MMEPKDCMFCGEQFDDEESAERCPCYGNIADQRLGYEENEYEWRRKERR